MGTQAQRFNGAEGWVMDALAADGRGGVRVADHMISVRLECLLRLPMVATPPPGGETTTSTSRNLADVAEDTSRGPMDVAEDSSERGLSRCAATAVLGAADE